MKKIPIKHRDLIKYIEYAKIKVKDDGILAHYADKSEQIPVQTLGSLILGPGTSITSAAVNIVYLFKKY